ncbi:hypothetical protein ACQKDD_08420 [Planococcus kocurii]|uniref:Uncharacterized protein n=1 Tax=Planococcus kocurii TaxID=1374 RepID=A0ABN4JVF7_9BACL|nr:hypothetical protein [Planococcus kocurii]ALS77905.1 hypothetical protein AUO94_04260 [Planococcus kocurii]
MTNNSQHKKDDHDSTFDKIVEKTSEMLSGSDEGWESDGQNGSREVGEEHQPTPDESTGDVPTEDKVVRDSKTGEKTMIKNDNKKWTR